VVNLTKSDRALNSDGDERSTLTRAEKIMSNPLAEPIAAVPYVVISDDGDHHLIGSRCGHCDATLVGRRVACAACGANDSIVHIQLATTGRIRTCTVINRSYPGVPVPFVAAVVDIDGGGVVRGTFYGDIPADPVAAVGNPVRICVEDTGQRDALGRHFYAQVFRSVEILA
jgi:uncharacterized protein